MRALHLAMIVDMDANGGTSTWTGGKIFPFTAWGKHTLYGVAREIG